MSHDQNFKNLILDYPHQALAFFAAEEAAGIMADAEILPVRQEQLKQRLGDRFRELDVPLLVQWPDGRREALLFVIEEESDPRRFSIHRLAHYCLDLAELLETDRVVPVVIFLRGEANRRELALGGERHTYLSFRFHHGRTASCPAAPVQIPACGTTARGSSKLLASHIRWRWALDAQKSWQIRGLASLKTLISSAKPFQL